MIGPHMQKIDLTRVKILVWWALKFSLFSHRSAAVQGTTVCVATLIEILGATALHNLKNFSSKLSYLGQTYHTNIKLIGWQTAKYKMSRYSPAKSRIMIPCQSIEPPLITSLQRTSARSLLPDLQETYTTSHKDWYNTTTAVHTKNYWYILPLLFFSSYSSLQPHPFTCPF